jgi:HlyD family secretion protein
MRTGRKLIPWIGISAALALALAALWFFWLSPAGSLSAAWNALIHRAGTVTPGTLKASGSVETTVLSIAPELPGKIIGVNFQEGDAVKAGQVLVQLDDATLQIQRRIAAADLEATGLELQKLNSPAVIADLQKTIAQDEQTVIDARQVLDVQKYFTNNEDAIQSARSKLYLARVALNKAHTAYDKVKYNNYLDATTKAMAQQNVYRAELNYENALALLNYLTGVPNPIQVDLKTAAVELAKAKLEEDQILLAALNGGPIPENATGTGIAQLQQARNNVKAAQARVDQLDDQIRKMTIKAPVDAVVMRRSAEPGNVVNPGTELLTLARLNDLTITLYVGEDEYGKINLGQAAAISVDAYPGETFHAAVVEISGQPAFLPRTTQTVASSRSTVYAIRLALQDGREKLKPGMSADVTFAIQ